MNQNSWHQKSFFGRSKKHQKHEKVKMNLLANPEHKSTKMMVRISKKIE
jgi:hypothetical protein